MTNPTLRAGFAFIDKVDKIARGHPKYGSDYKDKLHFAIWSRVGTKPAVLLRSHGIYREYELQSILRQTNVIL